MAERAELLAEAYRRGLLTGEKKDAYEEAMRRGLMPQQETPQQTPLSARGALEASRMTEEQLMERAAHSRAGTMRGLRDVGEGLKQFGLEIGEKIGLVDPGRASEYTKEVQRGREQYEQTPEGQSTEGTVGRFVGSVAPYMTIPGLGPATSLATRSAVAAGTGGVIGGTQFVPEDGSRAEQALTGAAVAGAVPGALTGAGKIVDKARGVLKGQYQDPRIAEAFRQGKQFDVPVYAPDVGGPGMQKISNYLEDVPVIGMRGPRTAQMKKAQEAAERIRDRYAPPDKGDIDRIIQTGLRNKESVVRAIKNKKYDRVAAAADDLGPVPATNMKQNADDIIKKQLERPAEYQDAALMKEVGKFTKDPNMTFSELQLLRAELGERIRALQTNKMPMKSGNELSSLKTIKSALEKDMEQFATSNSDDLARLWRNADKYYKMKFLPFKSAEIQRAIKNDEPDRIFDYFIKNGYGDRAKKFYTALDSSGRQAVRYNMIDRAYQKALDPERGVFSPAKFATEMRRVEDASGVFFKGQDKSLVDGFSNLMRHVERAGQAGPGPATGVQAVPFLMGAGIGGLYTVSPSAAAATGASAYMLRSLFRTETGKRLLFASAKAKPGTPQAERLMKEINDFLVKAAAVEASQP